MASDAALYARCGDEVDFARRIAELAADEELRRALTARARARRRELVWEQSEPELLRLYAEL
jgi:glycosyltransferase involved in cell wall biosynthesis